MKLLLSHPTGNAFVRAAGLGFVKSGLLAEFHTCIASFPGTFLDRLGSIEYLSEIRRRRFHIALKPYTHLWPWKELLRLSAIKLGNSSLVKHEKGPFSVDAVYKSLDMRVANRLKDSVANGVYAYEDGALRSFQEAKNLGIQCLYDLPIGYWRSASRLLNQEREKWPEWSSTLTGFKDSEEKLRRKDEELRLSDRIFVASSFTAQTLKDFPGPLAPVEIIPYGFPPVTSERDYKAILKDQPLKLLFVGGLSQRKGIANLFAAVEQLGNYASLTVVGRKASQQCAALDAALAKHTWIPSLPHHDILKLMREHDVLLFPSLFEGFGLVITEAMSQGTPVITTDRTAGPDLISHGENGWLVEAGSTQALYECIEGLFHDPDLIAKAGQAAMITARQRPWEVYSSELAEAVSKHRTGKA